MGSKRLPLGYLRCDSNIASVLFSYHAVVVMYVCLIIIFIPRKIHTPEDATEGSPKRCDLQLARHPPWGGGIQMWLC